MNQLPHESEHVFLTDSGLETDLIYNHGFDLPEFASFVLLDDEAGTDALRRYFAEHVQVAADSGYGIVLESPTWRANPGWSEKLGYDTARLRDVNERAVTLVHEAREAAVAVPVVVSGNVGPRGDGYVVAERMSAEQATDHSRLQAEAFAAAGADVMTALTLGYAEEAIGVAQAAAAAGLPSVISFTVEVDGRLPDGSTLAEAVEAVDVATGAATGAAPAYFMVNCAHPTHVAHALEPGAPWMARLGGYRANASSMSHAELDASTTLDDGDPVELGQQMAAIHATSPTVKVLGGCCGSDVRHIAQIAEALSV